jgi:hypothetical protein
MKRLTSQLLLAGLLTASMIACKKDDKASQFDDVSKDVLAQIKAHGFNNNNVQKVDEGYLVEGDIILTEEELAMPVPGTPNMIIAQEEHYRTYNVVNTTKYATITVGLKNSSAQHQAVFSAALDEAIARYNAQNLAIHFQRSTANKPNITVNSYYQVSNILGSSGFPTSRGAPYSKVQMNTFWYSNSTSNTNIDYIATIITHELGHCVGFRHTDYMNRAYSCGAGGGGNEGASTVGAEHIPGTPTGPDANSWMLACIGDNVNRPFTNNDQIALSTVY